MGIIQREFNLPLFPLFGIALHLPINLGLQILKDLANHEVKYIQCLTETQYKKLCKDILDKIQELMTEFKTSEIPLFLMRDVL